MWWWVYAGNHPRLVNENCKKIIRHCFSHLVPNIEFSFNGSEQKLSVRERPQTKTECWPLFLPKFSSSRSAASPGEER